MCFVSSGDRQLLSPFLLGRSLGELSHTGGSSHFPQSPGLCSDHSRHLRPNSAPLPSPAAAGGPRNWSTSPFLGPAGRVSRAQQSCVAGGSDRLHHPGRLWGCAWPWRPACIRPASGPVSVAPPPPPLVAAAVRERCSLRVVLCQTESSGRNPDCCTLLSAHLPAGPPCFPGRALRGWLACGSCPDGPSLTSGFISGLGRASFLVFSGSRCAAVAPLGGSRLLLCCAHLCPDASSRCLSVLAELSVTHAQVTASQKPPLSRQLRAFPFYGRYSIRSVGL